MPRKVIKKLKDKKNPEEKCEFCNESYDVEKDGKICCEDCGKALCPPCRMDCITCGTSYCDNHFPGHSCEEDEDIIDDEEEDEIDDEEEDLLDEPLEFGDDENEDDDEDDPKEEE